MGEILLCTSVSVERVVYQDFVNILESFVNHVEAWTEKIEKGDYGRDRHGSSSVSSDSPALPSDEPPGGFIRA
jgi:hypothetical protein